MQRLVPNDRLSRLRRTISSLFHRRPVGYVCAAVLLVVLALVWWPRQSVYTVRVTATVSSGRVLDVFFNDFRDGPLRADIVPGQRRVYEVASWPHAITRLRVDPTDTPGGTVSLEFVEVLSGDTVVSRFRAADLAAWFSSGVKRVAVDGQRLTVEITDNDPVFVSPTLSLLKPRGKVPGGATLQLLGLLAGFVLVAHVILRYGGPRG